MNNPNPFVPQGSLLEQKNRKRTRFQVMIFTIFAVNILVITPLLIQGCKRDSSTDMANQTPGVDTNTPITPDTNTALPPVPAPTNVVSSAPPAPVPVPAPIPTTTGATEYVIVRGDTLDSIHKKFSVSVKAIEDANPGIVPTKLQPGKKIQIPAATAPVAGVTTATADTGDVYVVKANDNLSKIATAHGTTVKAIEALNNMKTTKIKVGDKLKMPAAKTPAPPVDTTPAPAPAVTAPTAAPAPR